MRPRHVVATTDKAGRRPLTISALYHRHLSLRRGAESLGPPTMNRTTIAAGWRVLVSYLINPEPAPKTLSNLIASGCQETASLWGGNGLG